MKVRSSLVWSLQVFAVLLIFASSSQAQFTGNIQGIVVDPSGATIAQAKIVLVNTATQVVASPLCPWQDAVSSHL